MINNNLSGKVALVTGGSQGIGRGIASCLAQNGADVIVNYHIEDDVAASTVEYLTGFGVKVGVAKADVGDYAEVDRMVTKIIEDFGKIDILVNNAGIHRGGRIHRLSLEDWELVIRTHLFGAFHCCRAVVPYMLQNGQGRIINIVSPVGIGGSPGDSAYASAKGGMVGLTKCMALELARKNISVNGVAPGYVKTKMTGGLSASSIARIESTLPMGRSADPEEIGAAVAFLASPAASYITGAIFAADGGILAG
ncbi:MAG: 3-oxoacyl-ACP reductase family protein [Bacillota bacterium]